MTTLKNQVTNYLILKGNNINDVNEMIELHFEEAKRFNNVKSIAKFIRKIY
jgi:hypothetical protein